MLMPLDIENKTFSKSLSGYDKTEVDAFKDEVALEYGSIYKECLVLREKVSFLEESLTSYKSMEKTMHEALVVAQKTADDLKKNAEEKANVIIDRATQKSKEIIDTANSELSRIRIEYERIQKEIDLFKAKTVASLNAMVAQIQKNDTN